MKNEKSTDKTGHKKIQEEIEHRKLVVRKRGSGGGEGSPCTRDLSENFEYHAAKKDKKTATKAESGIWNVC